MVDQCRCTHPTCVKETRRENESEQARPGDARKKGGFGPPSALKNATPKKKKQKTEGPRKSVLKNQA